MKDAFVAVLGQPEGVVLYQLIFATQFTIYLSLIAFLGGGLVGAMITVARISPSKPARFLAQAYIWFFQSAPLLMLLFLFGLGVPRLLAVNVNIWLPLLSRLPGRSPDASRRFLCVFGGSM